MCQGVMVFVYKNDWQSNHWHAKKRWSVFIYVRFFHPHILGLHRYTRQLAELCCHTDSSNPTVPVKLPFVGDFFLMGAFDEPDLTCLPIENTHVRGYNEYPFINPT